MNTNTRTDKGYDSWKENPRTVREARIQAEGLIARKELKRMLIDSWAAPTVEWLNRKLPGGHS